MWSVGFQRFLSFLAFSCACCCVHCKTPLFVGVLLPTNPTDPVLARFRIPPVQLAVEHINASPDILPNHEIVLEVRNSACDIGLAGYELYRLLSQTNETMVALIGESCSTVTQPLAQISKHFNIPQFNFLSTSPALDDRETYPYYYHILPTENDLNPSRVALMTSLGWSHSLILVQPSDIFDLNAKNLRDEMTNAGLQRPEILLLSDDFKDTIKHIKDTDIHILFGLFYQETGRQAICELYRQGIHAPDYVWVFVGWYSATDWYLTGSTNCTESEMAAAVKGHFTVDFSRLSAHHSERLPTGKTVKEVAEDLRRRLNMTNDTPINETFQKYSAYGYDLTVALGLVFNKTVNHLVDRGQIEKLENFSYDSLTIVNATNEILGKQIFGFEGLTGRVEFYNLKLTDGRNHEYAGGNIDIYYNRNVTDSALTFRYNNARESLTKVQQIRWTTHAGVRPVDRRPHTLRYSDEPMFILVVLLACIGIIGTLALLFFNSMHRRHWMVMKSVPRLNELLLAGSLLVYVSVILFGFDGQFFKFNDSSLVSCFLSTSFLAIGFSVTFGAVLVRTVTKIVGQYFKKTFESLLVLLGTLLIGLLLFIDGLIFIVWFAINPWEKGEQILEQNGRAIFVREKCTSVEFWGYVLIVYKLIVLILCLVAAIIRVHIRKSTSGVRTSYTDLLVSMTGLGMGFAAFGFMFISDPGLQFVLVSVSLVLLVTIIIVLLFGKQVYVVWKGLSETEVVQSQRQSGIEMTTLRELSELERVELKELRNRNCNLKIIVEKLLLERPVAVHGSLADDVRSVFGYLPGDSVTTQSSCENDSVQASK